MPSAISIVAFARQVAGITLGGAVVGLALNALSSRPVALTKPILSTADVVACDGAAQPTAIPIRITQAEALKACNACTAAFVDARGEAAYAEGHILGAIHLPPHEHEDEAATIDQLRKFSMVIVYDDQAACQLATGVAHHLMTEGLKDVRVLDGSWLAWQESGNPAQSGACEVCTHPAESKTEGSTP